MKALEKIFGDPNKKTLKKIQPIVDEINALEPEFKNLTLDQLKGKTAEFKARLEKGETLDDILPAATIGQSWAKPLITIGCCSVTTSSKN